MSEIKDYLFIDLRRIKSYHDQISSGKPHLKAEKHSKWGFSAGLTSLGVKGDEAVTFRDPTVLERMEYVISHIKKSELFSSDNLGGWWNPEKAIFYERVFNAQKATILPSKISDAQLGHLAVWIPDNIEVEETKIAIYLIEACPEEDREYYDSFSGYTALEFLIYNLGDEIKDFKDSLIMDNENQNKFVNRDELFPKDPIGYLKKLGAFIGPKRRIKSFFRKRLDFADYLRETDKQITGVIGYPIFIHCE